MDTAKLARFVEIEKARRELETRLEELKAERATLEEELLRQFQESGIDSMRVDGMTVYLKREIWAGAKDGDYERACRALREAGLDQYVQERFNTQSLSAYVREQARLLADDTAGPDEILAVLPEPLRDAISVTEKFSLRTRKA